MLSLNLDLSPDPSPEEAMEIAGDLLIAAQGCEPAVQHVSAPAHRTALFHPGCTQIERAPSCP